MCNSVQPPANLLTARETAQRLSVSLRKLEQMLHNGEGPRYVRLGSVRRWDWADVQQWLDKHKVGDPQ